MKSAAIFFRNINDEFDGDYYSRLIKAFADAGLKIDTLEVLSSEDDLGFKRRFTEFKDLFDNLIIIGGDVVDFNIKQFIAQEMDSALIENENAKNFVDAVSKTNGQEYPEEFALLPIEATVIPNLTGGFQGFILDANDMTISLLPSAFEEVKTMCDKYVLPYLENKLGIKQNRLILKYFGDIQKLKDTLFEAQNIGDNEFKWNAHENCGDVLVELMFDENYFPDLRNDVVRYIITNLKDNVYAQENVSLSQRLFDLLKLKNLKLSIAESFTGGRVASEMIKNSGVSEFLNEGIVSYSNQSKMKRLKVNALDLQRHGAVSSVVAYQMSAGLLRDGDCDIAIATTGIAGPKSDDTEKPVGLCYIAVGMKDGVHTYRYRLDGDRERITETAKNTALFLAIKKLKTL